MMPTPGNDDDGFVGTPAGREDARQFFMRIFSVVLHVRAFLSTHQHQSRLVSSKMLATNRHNRASFNGAICRGGRSISMWTAADAADDRSRIR